MLQRVRQVIQHTHARALHLNANTMPIQVYHPTQPHNTYMQQHMCVCGCWWWCVTVCVCMRVLVMTYGTTTHVLLLSDNAPPRQRCRRAMHGGSKQRDWPFSAASHMALRCNDP